MLDEPVEPILADKANHFYEGQCQFQQTMQTVASFTLKAFTKLKLHESMTLACPGSVLSDLDSKQLKIVCKTKSKVGAKRAN